MSNLEKLDELKVIEYKKMKLLVDNKSQTGLANHPMSHGMRKHIERKYHFRKDQVNKERVKLEYCKLELQLVNIFTKPLKETNFKDLNRLMEIRRLKNMNYVECCVNN